MLQKFCELGDICCFIFYHGIKVNFLLLDYSSTPSAHTFHAARMKQRNEREQFAEFAHSKFIQGPNKSSARLLLFPPRPPLTSLPHFEISKLEKFKHECSNSQVQFNLNFPASNVNDSLWCRAKRATFHYEA